VASSPVVRIVEQLHHTPSSDGSYTFAFSSEDGTFRIERRDGGYVVGKYGFIDSQSGLQQVTGELGQQGAASFQYYLKTYHQVTLPARIHGSAAKQF